jgi:hypothetical protein
MQNEPGPGHDAARPGPDDSSTGLSRRALLGGIGAAGAIGLATSVGGPSHVMAAGDDVGAVPDALEAPVDGLVYLPLDATAFDVATTEGDDYRLYQSNTGMQPQDGGTGTEPRYLYASLPIPIGSIIRRINIGYYGQPIISIARRSLTTTDNLQIFGPLTTSGSGSNPRSQTFSTNVTLTAGAAYVVEVFCLAGESVRGVEIGYIPPAQAFVPYTGVSPRALDSRTTTKFGPNEERVIDLSSRLIATARAAVINLTATDTEGPGYLAAFRDGIPHPGNSSLNFTTAGATVANGVICQMTNGKIKVRTGPAGSHVIVDVIGSLL